jgi:hypothetical protein
MLKRRSIVALNIKVLSDLDQSSLLIKREIGFGCSGDLNRRMNEVKPVGAFIDWFLSASLE